MNETQLQIVISAVNEAAAQLSEIGGQLEGLGTQAATASTEISSSLTAAEEAAAEAAEATIASWDDASGDIAGAIATAAEEAGTSFMDISSAALSAADQMAEDWQSSLAELETMMTAADTELVGDATVTGEAMGSAAGEGFIGVFRSLMIGYGLEKVGEFLSGGVTGLVTAAQQSGNQISNLTSQIESQKASIAVNEAALQKWTGTTAEVNAAHEKAAANIQAETLKIQELQQQLAPLETAQEGLAGSITKMENATLDWIGSQPQLENFLQVFSTTLGPLLEFTGVLLIVVTMFGIMLAMIDPVWLIMIALSVAVAAGIAIWSSFHTQIMAFLDDLNANTGIVLLFQQAWQQISEDFTTNLLPALQRLWTALQPLTPLFQAMGEVIGATLLGAIVLLVVALTTTVTWLTNILTASTNLATFFTNVLVAAINDVENALNAVFNSAAYKAVSGLLGGAASAAGSVLSAVSSSVTHVQDAIITPGGGVIQTDVADYLIATKNPGALAGNAGGGGGGITININGGSYLNQGGAQQIAQALATMIGQQLKLKVR